MHLRFIRVHQAYKVAVPVLLVFRDVVAKPWKDSGPKTFDLFVG